MTEKKQFEWSDFDLLCILKYILRNLWLVVLTALLCVMAVYLMQSLVMTPVYSSETTFAVTSRSTAGVSGGNIATTDTIAGQFGELLQSDVVQNAAAKRMGLDTFPATVSVSVPENTNIICMSVVADSPELAYKSSLAIIECHWEYSSSIFSTVTLDSINGPLIPTRPSNLNSRNTILKLSAPAGAAAMIILLIFFAIQEDTIQTVSGARRQIDGKFLTTIYHERRHDSLSDRLRRKKSALLITNPTCSFYYTETIHQLRVLLEHEKTKNGHKVFLVTSCSENEGKSTIAANLALSLAQKHRRVLLLDADLRKPAQALIFDKPVQHGKTLGALLGKGFSEKLLRESVSYCEAEQLYALYAEPLRRKKAEAFSTEAFRPLLDALRKEFSFIIIDTPPIGLFTDAEVIADAADASLLVVRQNAVPAIAINDAIDGLNDSDSNFLGYIINNLRSFRAMAMPSGDSGYGYGYGGSYTYGKQPDKPSERRHRHE